MSDTPGCLDKRQEEGHGGSRRLMVSSREEITNDLSFAALLLCCFFFCICFCLGLEIVDLLECVVAKTVSERKE